MRRTFPLLLMPLALAAQDSRCLVEGMVANAATGEALHRAVVTLRRTGSVSGASGPTSYTASTDPLGKFAIADIDPGIYLLSAERNGFAPARDTTRIKLDRGQKSTGQMVLLPPHAVITGKITDEDGEPVIGADVQVSTLSYSQGRKQLSRAGGATTNDLGEYRAFGLAPGKYWVSATARSNPVLPAQEEFTTTYYPRTTDAGSAMSLEVAAGAQLRNIDITLARVRTVSVRGKISTEIEGEKRIVNVMLLPGMVMGIASMVGGHARRRSACRWQLRDCSVAPGTDTLQGMANVDGKSHAAPIPLQVGSTNIENLQLTIRAGATINGKLRLEGRPEQDLAVYSVGLQVWESGGVLFNSLPAVKTQTDGSFQLTDLGVDHYGFFVNGLPEGHYLKSVRSGGTDVLVSGLEVSGGAAPLEVLISPNAGGLEGTAMDPRSQKPAAGARVVLVPQSKERAELYRAVEADDAGRFRFKTVVPGEYRVYGWETVLQYAWMDPDVMRPLKNKGEAVSILEGSPQSVQVSIIVGR